jgi:hypothetical protein
MMRLRGGVSSSVLLASLCLLLLLLLLDEAAAAFQCYFDTSGVKRSSNSADAIDLERFKKYNCSLMGGGKIERVSTDNYIDKNLNKPTMNIICSS